MTPAVLLLALTLQVAPVPRATPPPVEYRECQFCHRVQRAQIHPDGLRYKFLAHEFITIRTSDNEGFETCLQAVVDVFKRLGAGRAIHMTPPDPEKKEKQ